MYNSLSIHGGVCNELGLFPELSEGKRRRGERYEFLMSQALLGGRGCDSEIQAKKRTQTVRHLSYFIIIKV